MGNLSRDVLDVANNNVFARLVFDEGNKQLLQYIHLPDTENERILGISERGKYCPVEIFVGDKNELTIVNIWAIEQRVTISVNSPAIAGMLEAYMQYPAVNYRQIHHIASKPTVLRLRRFITDFTLHTSSHSKLNKDLTMRLLRAYTIMGDVALADKLEKISAMEGYAIATTAGPLFDSVMEPYHKTEVAAKAFRRLLELMAGYVVHEAVSDEVMVHMPYEGTQEELSPVAARWAYEHGLISYEQLIGEPTNNEINVRGEINGAYFKAQ